MLNSSETAFFGGAEEKIKRLGLSNIWDELKTLLAEIPLNLDRSTNAIANPLPKLLNRRFRSALGWKRKYAGRLNWTKCREIDGIRACVGLRFQFSVSAESDLILVDLQYLCDEIVRGRIDVGVLVVGSDNITHSVGDRVVKYADAVKAVKRVGMTDLPLSVLAIRTHGYSSTIARGRTLLVRTGLTN